jgi:hypothetical protein
VAIEGSCESKFEERPLESCTFGTEAPRTDGATHVWSAREHYYRIEDAVTAQRACSQLLGGGVWTEP